MLEMLEWYWWVLIVIAVIVGGYFKLKIAKQIFGKKEENPIEED